MTDLEAIEARAEAATDGWVRDGTLWAGGYVEIDLSANDCEDWLSIKSRRPEVDAAFLGAARSDVLCLLAEVRRLRAAAAPVIERAWGPYQETYKGDYMSVPVEAWEALRAALEALSE